jgi:hypothetical protein
LPIPQGVWQDLTMDFIEGLPKSEGYDSIMVVVDRFSKFAHFFPLKHPFTAAKVAQVFLDNVVKLHGTPRSIVSDRDKVFTSNFWKAFFSALNTKLALTTAYHPQSDGQSERVNQCLEMYLRCAISDSPTQWKKWLPLAEFWYNSSYHTALKCSPFKALYGYEPVFAAAPVMAKTGDQLVEGLLAERKAHSEILKQKLASAQNRMKMQADKNRTDREFMVGEFVLVKLQPYVQSTVVSRPCPKLALKYFGPFKILQKIGLVAYKLELPSSSQIHPVFHVSQLKAFTPSTTPVYSDLSQMVDLSGADVKPLKILERRLVRRGNHPVVQVKVLWSHFTDEVTTWEDYDVLKTRFFADFDWDNQTLGEGKMSDA